MKVKILTDNHTHAGQPVPPGTVIDMDQPLADYMIELKLAEPAKEENTKKEAKHHGNRTERK